MFRAIIKFSIISFLAITLLSLAACEEKEPMSLYTDETIEEKEGNQFGRIKRNRCVAFDTQFDYCRGNSDYLSTKTILLSSSKSSSDRCF